MKIEQFRIKDFKSIKELVIEDLNAINVFYGLNDAGKSNIVQALQLWFFCAHERNPDILFQKFSQTNLYRFGCFKIELEALLKLNWEDTKNFVEQLGNVQLKAWSLEDIRLKVQFVIEPKYNVKTILAIGIPNQKMFNLTDSLLLGIKIMPFHLIDANRRIYSEYWEQAKSNQLGVVTATNLKQNLFYAYLSRDFQHKQRFEAVKNILTQEPFNLGVLDVALDPQSNEIDVGFVQQNNRLPIEQFGSGTQQLLLMLGQLFLNNYPLVALEEPEMNLSPTHQANLISTLQKLMQEPSSGLKQLFISTHSPYLEFTENAYYVFRGEDGWTQVKKVGKKEAENYFALESRGEENGARLNSQNQITLRDNIVQDLNLERGDFVFVLKNEVTGRWELHTEEEISQKLEKVLRK